MPQKCSHPPKAKGRLHLADTTREQQKQIYQMCKTMSLATESGVLNAARRNETHDQDSRIVRESSSTRLGPGLSVKSVRPSARRLKLTAGNQYWTTKSSTQRCFMIEASSIHQNTPLLTKISLQTTSSMTSKFDIVKNQRHKHASLLLQL